MKKRNGGIIKTPGAKIFSAASVVGRKEHEGPLGERFDLYDTGDRFGCKTWEMAESEMQRMALSLAMERARLTEGQIGALFAGDLLNQCVGSAYGLLDFDIPYFGLYGACSTAAEGMALAALAVSGGFIQYAGAVTSSHNAAAERQYRTPLEYGGQRPPTAQWTVTGAGAFIIGHATRPETEIEDIADISDSRDVAATAAMANIADIMPGIVIERGITDTANMGAAMAPAAAETLQRYFAASGRAPESFDLILTGDLGFEGHSILCELLEVEGVGHECLKSFDDCGRLIYERAAQDVHSGGSGCGCSAVVMASHILPQMAAGELCDILFVGTGAMMSPSSTKQGQPIPAVAHLLHLTSAKNNDRGEECRLCRWQNAGSGAKK